jgi:hypothetical protein
VRIGADGQVILAKTTPEKKREGRQIFMSVDLDVRLLFDKV